MNITIPCTCGKKLQVDENHRGKKVKCPACDRVLVVEAAETAVQAEAPPLTPAGAASKSRPSVSRLDAAGKRSSMPLIIGIGCVVLGLPLLVCAGAGGAGFWFWRTGAAEAEKALAKEQADAQEKDKRRADQRISQNNLKNIALAMHNYHDNFKRLPAYATGVPQTQQLNLSWRVLLLPYLEEIPLYKQIKLDEPWDSVHNRQFHNKTPKVYHLPGKPNDGKTYYQVFFGDGAMYSRQLGFGPPQQIAPNAFGIYPPRYKIHTVPDGTSNTIFAVEAAEPVNWMKPEDIPFAVGPQGTPLTRVGNHWGDDTFHAALYDGAVLRVRRAIPPAMLQLLITPDDGQAINYDPWVDR